MSRENLVEGHICAVEEIDYEYKYVMALSYDGMDDNDYAYYYFNSVGLYLYYTLLSQANDTFILNLGEKNDGEKYLKKMYYRNGTEVALK